MPSARIILSLALVAVLFGAASADEKTNQEKIIGAWEMTKAPPEAGFSKSEILTLVFTKDGKYALTTGNNADPTETGIYDVVNDTITNPADTVPMKIKKLTDKELAVEYTKDDKKIIVEFKKK